MKIDNIEGVSDLTLTDAKAINGGDQFMYDLGQSIGSACGWMRNQLSSFGDFLERYPITPSPLR